MTLANSKRDYAISIVRLLATASIVLCHILQYRDNVLAWWFNVGVQIFLVMSGYLYGLRADRPINDIAFYKKNFSKILLDYYLVVIPVLILQIIMNPGKISGDRAYKILFTYKQLAGGQHLWFIPYILVCYLITPFLSRFFTSLKDRASHLILGFLGLLLFNHLLHDTFFKYFNAVWINCYIIGIFLGCCQTTEHKRIKCSMIGIISILAIVFNAVRICILYVWKVQVSEPYDELMMLFYDISHGLLGCFLFFAMRFLFTPLAKLLQKSDSICKFLEFTDSLCFDIYLVHQFFILDRYSLMDRTDNPALNICMILILTLIFALIVWTISGFLSRKRHVKSVV